MNARGEEVHGKDTYARVGQSRRNPDRLRPRKSFQAFHILDRLLHRLSFGIPCSNNTVSELPELRVDNLGGSDALKWVDRIVSHGLLRAKSHSR